MRTLTRRVDRLMRRQPKRMGPVHVWYSFDDGRTPENKPTPEQMAAIDAAGGLMMQVEYVTPQHAEFE